MRGRDRITALLCKVVVAMDGALRCGVVVVAFVLIREFWGEPEPNSDGLPVGLLVVPLLGYIGWNVAVIGWSIRRWAGASLVDVHFLTKIGGLSALRLLLLLALADDVMYRHRGSLMVLVVASLVCALLALILAIDRADGIYQRPDRRNVGQTLAG